MSRTKRRIIVNHDGESDDGQSHEDAAGAGTVFGGKGDKKGKGRSSVSAKGKRTRKGKAKVAQ